MVVLIVGTAPGHERGVQTVKALMSGIPHVTIGVNRAFQTVPCDFIYSWHEDFLVDHLDEITVPCLCPSTNGDPRIAVVTLREHGGSSGLNAIFVALDWFRAERVVTVGIRLEKMYGRFRKAWAAHDEDLRHRVRGFRDYAEELFGPVTREWLEGGAE